MSDNEITVKVLTDVDTAPVDALEEQIESEHTFTVESGDIDEAEDKAEEVSDEIETEHTLSVDSSDLDEAQEKAEETASTMDSLTTAAAGIGLSAGVENMITTADNINTSWNRLKLTFGDTGVSMDTLKQKASQASAETGRSGGAIRGYFNQMGIAGVTNADLLSSSFEALSGRAYQTGNDIEGMETKLQTMVLSGNVSARALKGLGLSAEELGASMGVTADEVSKAFEAMTPEERLAAISKAMGDGAEANEMYKNSYAGLKEQADAAMAGLAGAVGEAILPIVIPALQGATSFVKMLADGFKSLPGPLQSVIGGLLGFAGITLSAVGILGTMGKVIGSVSKGLQTFGDIEAIGKLKDSLISVGSTAKDAATSLINMGKNAALTLKDTLVSLGTKAKDAALALADVGKKALLAGANAVKSAAMWAVQKAALIAQKIAAYASAAAEWALNIAMDANPIMLVVLAIIALVAILGYLYYNNEQVRAAVDALGQTFMWIANTVISAVTSALQWLSDLFTQFTSQLGLDSNDWIQSVLGFILFMQTLPIQIGVALVNTLARALGFKGDFVQSMISAAANAVTGFVSKIQELYGIVQSEFARIEGLVSDFVTSLPQRVWDLGASVVDALKSALGIGSPGHMFYMLEGEFNRMDDLTKDTSFDTGSIGTDMVNNFNPNLASSGASMVGGTNNITINIDSVDNKERIDEIVKAVEDALAFDNLTAGRTV